MFGAIPKTSWSRRYPSNAQNGCVLAMRSLLIEADGRIILVDNGAGYKHLKTLSYYQFFDLQDLHEALRKRGIEPTDVTDMVFTHLHFDHCGYTTLQEPAKRHAALSLPQRQPLGEPPAMGELPPASPLGAGLLLPRGYGAG